MVKRSRQFPGTGGQTYGFPLRYGIRRDNIAAMVKNYDGEAAAMGSTETPAEHPATSGEMTAALNAALAAGDLHSIMGVMGEMARAHRMRRVARETGLGEKSLYKSMRAGASPEFNTVLRVLRSLGFRLQAVPLSSNDSQ